jgi:leucyl-tRNA synthetase
MAVSTGAHDYAPGVVEERQQASWGASGAFDTPPPDERAPAYIFTAPPFPTGALHMGHVRSYVLADAYARYRRATGSAVLFSIGFDSFGLPAELAAMRRGEEPQEWVDNCCDTMRRQLKRLGLSFDWSREYVTSDEEMYRWSQWLFLTLVERGLVYQATGWIDWCENCQTSLASMQVEDGGCWRCHGPIRVVHRKQWYLRVTRYAEENGTSASAAAAPEQPEWQAAQKAVLGKLDGFEVTARAADGRELPAFVSTSRAVEEVRCVLMSPRHPDIDDWVTGEESREQLDGLRKGGWDRIERGADHVPLLWAGVDLALPGIDRPLPLVVSPTVDSRYGETAVLCVADGNRTDTRIVERLPVMERPTVDTVALRAAMRPATRYRVRDFVLSRQRDWGAPIPTVACPACGDVPVPERDLPVTHADRGAAATCPACGGPATHERDTLDCHFDGLWWWLANCVPADARGTQMFDHPELRRWLPGDCLIWGVDGSGYVFDQRAIVKALRDSGEMSWLEAGEPFERALLHEMVRFDGRKMSKHLGNVVEPEEIVKTWGADALRLAVATAAAPRSSFTWSGDGLKRSHAVLVRLWRFAQRIGPEREADPGEDRGDPHRRRLARWCEAAGKRIGEDMESFALHRASHNAVELLERMETFERRVREARGDLDGHDRAALRRAFLLLLELSAPFIPHICDELWAQLGEAGTATGRPWPLPPGSERAPATPAAL